MSVAGDTRILREQLEYYGARAGEYDEWWLRQGRYDHGAALNDQWRDEGQSIARALTEFQAAGRVLELACGTGIWTEQLARTAATVVAVDGSSEVLAVNRRRVLSPHVSYVQADLFEWRPTEQFDAVFFSFWLSHVPPERFEDFWRLVERCLAPGGRVFFADSRREPSSTARDHRLPGPEATTLQRRLNDGREYQIYKVFYDAPALTDQLRTLGWDFVIHQTPHYFLYGVGHRA
ncbi:MAG: methyltransferase domain-containing protein [Vicinamibacterales bacterium]